jgi:hypothetical protein
MSLSQTLSQPDYHPTIQAFRDWIRKTCAPGIIDPSSDSELELKFLPTNTLEDYFKSDGYRNLAKLLKAVYYGEPPVREEEIARKYSRVFGILILIGKAEFIATFVSYDNLRDACLPFSFQEPPAHFPDTYDGELLRQFCENQWIFCAPVLDDSTTRKFDDRLILPVILKEKLASGGSARLYKIILQDKHNNLRPIKVSSQKALADLGI